MQNSTSFIVAKASRIIIFGCPFLIVGSSLALYYYYKSLFNAENYYHTEINYQKVYLNESANKIVLISNEKEYGLLIILLNANGKTDFMEALKELSSSSSAEIWLDNKDAKSPFIRGIKAANFYLSPEIGASEDTKDDKSFAELCLYFSVGGVVIIVLGLIKSLSGNKPKKINW